MKNEEKRNLHAISAHFRKAGAHKDKQESLDKKENKKYIKDIQRDYRLDDE